MWRSAAFKSVGSRCATIKDESFWIACNWEPTSLDPEGVWGQSIASASLRMCVKQVACLGVWPLKEANFAKHIWMRLPFGVLCVVFLLRQLRLTGKPVWFEIHSPGAILSFQPPVAVAVEKKGRLLFLLNTPSLLPPHFPPINQKPCQTQRWGSCS